MSLAAILFSFKGRINRAKYWMVTLLMIVILFIFICGLILSDAGDAGSVILLPFYIFGNWAGLAVAAKRWHDLNKSAWWILIAFIPIIGPIWAFVELGFYKGTDGPNRFGPDPLKNQ